MNRVKGGFAQSDSIDYSPDCYLQTRLGVYLLSEYPHNSLSNFRGTGNKREQPFRESYGRIGHINLYQGTISVHDCHSKPENRKQDYKTAQHEKPKVNKAITRYAKYLFPC